MDEVDRSQSVLLVGGPSTGKTIYGAQLLSRLQADRGNLRLRHAPENIDPFKAALHRLSQGLLAKHTSVATYNEVVLPLELPTGVPVDLVWPDYGGEQIRRIMNQRWVSVEWRDRIRTSTGWLLFIRPSMIHSQNDVFSRPIHKVVKPANGVEEDRQWSQQAWYTELLQILLFIRGVGVLERVSAPRLAVVLSCWDEIASDGNPDTPEAALSARLPMFRTFLRSVWDVHSVSVFGVSSLGRALNEDSVDEEYVDFGPHNFGYAVPSEGGKDDDLSLPIQWLLSGP